MSLTAVALRLPQHAAPRWTDLNPQPADAEYTEWQRIASRERDRRDAAIRKWEHEHGLDAANFDRRHTNTPRDRIEGIVAGAGFEEQLSVTKMLPSKLLSLISQGKLSAERTLKAFATRACLAHRLTNPLTEVFFDRGLARAQELDRYFEATGKIVGPLHGLPISVKDAFNIKGMDTTLGMVSRVGQSARSTDTLIERLHEAGAVLYCKTNIPQSLMSGECMNYVFGCTTSAHNLQLSAGGSSGGEGSLIALGGSPLGIGTDIAGSIRTPANFNGIYGLCPSFGRFPLHGSDHAPGIGPINGVAGPLSRSIDGLEVYAKSLLQLHPWEWDSSCIRLPWDQSIYEEYAPQSLNESGITPGPHKLCFGIVPTDSVMTPHPPIQRCLRQVSEALVEAGHSVIELPDFFDARDALWDLLTSYFRSDGGIELQAELARLNEPFVPGTLEVKPEDALSAGEVALLAKQVRNLQQKYQDRWRETWRLTPTKKPVDVLILPSGVHTACPHGTMNYWLYEAISNVLDWTCATIPVGFVDAELDSLNAAGSLKQSPYSADDEASLKKFSVETYRDAPVCLQVMGQRLTEEKVLGCLRTIDRALGRDEEFQA